VLHTKAKGSEMTNLSKTKLLPARENVLSDEQQRRLKSLLQSCSHHFQILKLPLDLYSNGHSLEDGIGILRHFDSRAFEWMQSPGLNVVVHNNPGGVFTRFSKRDIAKLQRSLKYWQKRLMKMQQEILTGCERETDKGLVYE
jgi:hypothetical protein